MEYVEVSDIGDPLCCAISIKQREGVAFIKFIVHKNYQHTVLCGFILLQYFLKSKKKVRMEKKGL